MRRATQAVVVAVLLVGCPWPARAQTAASAPSSPPRFSSRVDLVPLEICVKNRDGQPTPGLQPSDFMILEDDVLQRIAFFFPDQHVRLAVTLLVDASQSMKGERLERARTAAAGFIDVLRDGDLIEVMSFNERAALRYPLGPHRREAAAALDAIQAGGRTGLHEAVLAALGRFTRAGLSADDYRQVLVLLSDGEDTSSLPTFEDVLDEARRGHVMVYTVTLPGEKGTATGPGWQMTRLARDTGGRTVAARSLHELVPLYQEIGTELIHLYRVGYVPATSRRAAGWRSIKVSVPGKDVIVRTRSGYYASATQVPRRSELPQRPQNPGMQVARNPSVPGTHGNGR
jgi:VWFA-related protein